MIFKVSTEETPKYFRSLFTRSTSRYGSKTCIPPHPRIYHYNSSLAFSGYSIGNSLPPFIKNL